MSTSNNFFDGVEWLADVRLLGKPMEVIMSFASEKDMGKISLWADFADYPAYYSYSQSPPRHLTRDQKDILEYAALLEGMYRTYEMNDRFAGSANRLERIIRENPREDVLFVLVMKLPPPAFGDATGPFISGEVLGFAAMRHTWKNTLKLEFLAASPLHMGTDMELQGVGSALLTASVELSKIMSAPMFWAESTDTSLGFYLKQKFKTLEDIVYLDAEGIAKFVRSAERKLHHDAD